MAYRQHVTDGTPCWCDPIVEDYRVNGDYVKVGEIQRETGEITEEGKADALFGVVTEVFSCPKCKALVSNPERHDAWHEGDNA